MTVSPAKFFLERQNCAAKAGLMRNGGKHGVVDLPPLHPFTLGSHKAQSQGSRKQGFYDPSQQLFTRIWKSEDRGVTQGLIEKSTAPHRPLGVRGGSSPQEQAHLKA